METQFSGNFVEMISSSLGSNAMTWFRELSTTFADRPITWDLFKAKLCERFKEKDHAYKTLTKMFDLRYKSCASQEDYASKYQTYLSTLKSTCPTSSCAGSREASGPTATATSQLNNPRRR